MGKHLPEAEEIDYTDDMILPPDTPLWVRALCYIVVAFFAALGFWAMYLEIFV